MKLKGEGPLPVFFLQLWYDAVGTDSGFFLMGAARSRGIGTGEVRPLRQTQESVWCALGCG